MRAIVLGDIKRLEYVFPASALNALEIALGGRVSVFDTQDRASYSPLLPDIEYLFLSWDAPLLDAEMLDGMPKLKAVFYGAGTVKYFLSDAFWERSIRLSSAWGMNAVPVADYVLAEVTLGLKRGRYYNRMLRARKGYPSLYELFEIPSLVGSTVGLISLGKVGRLVRDRLRALDAHVLAWDPFLTPQAAEEAGVEKVELEALFERSDVVSLHTPWLKETENLIRGHHLERMKPMSTFINTARGAIVNEAEMCSVLERRSDLDAVIDVTWPEPPAEDSPLYRLPNAHLTPHIAGSLGRECSLMGMEMVEELKRLLAGEPLQSEVTRSMLATMA